VQSHRTEVLVPSPKSSLDDQIKTNLLERTPPKSVVQAAECNRGFFILSPKVVVK
jgi:hypothetical protein